MPRRLGKARTRAEKIEASLTDNDRAELVKFASFLQDKATMERGALYTKHAEYLGLTIDDLHSLEEALK